MRFLIFNVVVFLSIGYLFTAAPGQSVGNWLDGTIDMVSQTLASAPLTAAPKQISAPEDKPVQSAVSLAVPSKAQNDDIKITADKIQKIISDSINSNLKEIAAGFGDVHADKPAPLPRLVATTAVPADQTRPSPIDRASQTSVTGKTQESVKQNTMSPSSSQAPAEADALLANGFSEHSPGDQNAVSTARDELEQQDTVAAPVFMNQRDRQAALSELIQNLQLTYLERAGQ